MHLTTDFNQVTTSLTPTGELQATYVVDGERHTVTFGADDFSDLLAGAGYFHRADDEWTHDNDLLEHHIVSAAIAGARADGYDDGLDDAGEHSRSNAAEAEADLGHMLEVTTRWHNDTHPGTYQFCDLEPCRELRRGPL